MGGANLKIRMTLGVVLEFRNGSRASNVAPSQLDWMVKAWANAVPGWRLLAANVRGSLIVQETNKAANKTA